MKRMAAYTTTAQTSLSRTVLPTTMPAPKQTVDAVEGNVDLTSPRQGREKGKGSVVRQAVPKRVLENAGKDKGQETNKREEKNNSKVEEPELQTKPSSAKSILLLVVCVRCKVCEAGVDQQVDQKHSKTPPRVLRVRGENGKDRQAGSTTSNSGLLQLIFTLGISSARDTSDSLPRSGVLVIMRRPGSRDYQPGRAHPWPRPWPILSVELCSRWLTLLVRRGCLSWALEEGFIACYTHFLFLESSGWVSEAQVRVILSV